MTYQLPAEVPHYSSTSLCAGCVCVCVCVEGRGYIAKIMYSYMYLHCDHQLVLVHTSLRWKQTILGI